MNRIDLIAVCALALVALMGGPGITWLALKGITPPESLVAGWAGSIGALSTLLVTGRRTPPPPTS